MAKKRGLGKGLDALLSAVNSAPAPVSLEAAEAVTAPVAMPVVESEAGVPGQQLAEVAVTRIQRGRYQPRRDMSPQALEELAASIRQQGVMQPIVVRPIGAGQYEIIAGERRWRAAQQAGLDRVPAVIRDVADEAAIAMALIENIQREDLNPIEEAIALKRLQDEFELTQQEVADAVGKSRSAVTNLLRLLQLDPEVRLMLEHGDLEMGHARALLTLPAAQQIEAANQVSGQGLSVRQTEALARQISQPAQAKPAKAAVDPNIRQLEEKLGERLGARVQIQHGAKGKGKLVIHYHDLAALDAVLGHIK